LKLDAVHAFVRCFASAQRAHVPRQALLRWHGHNHRSMRKLLLSLLLPFVLLLSQQGAVVHEISHLADATTRVVDGREQGGRQPGDLQCEACLAFAHLAGMATAQVVPPALLSFGFQIPANAAPVFIPSDAPTARSRGPPTLL
jgi:hypothetical protein